MKSLLLLSLFVSIQAFSAECKLVGVLESTQKIETSFVTSTAQDCLKMAKQTKSNRFYGFIEKNDKLVKTVANFKGEQSLMEEIHF